MFVDHKLGNTPSAGSILHGDPVPGGKEKDLVISIAAGHARDRRVVLRVNRLSKSFGGLVALSEVTFVANPGKVTAVIGPNGAGKTTLFNVISGIFREDAGTIQFGEKDITNMPAWRRARLGIARTFQNIRLFPELSVAENVIAAVHDKGSVRHVVPKVLGLLQLLGVEGRADMLAGSVPIGDQRRIEIARALSRDPNILMLDEPGAGLAEEEAAHLLENIGSMRDWGLTILLVDHNMRLVRAIADRIVVLDHGRIIAEGTSDEIARDSAVRQAYLGES